MEERNCMKMLKRQWSKSNFVSVGLDVDMNKIPEAVKPYDRSRTVFSGSYIIERITLFNKAIIANTAESVCAYKPNIAFYEQYGEYGLEALKQTIEYIKFTNKDIPIILDCKRADIGNTNKGYVEAAFNYFGADAITVNPYFGGESLKPFLEQKDKGIIVLCRTSNSGAGEFQDLIVSGGNMSKSSMPLYQYVAQQVSELWNENENCMLVVGATNPEELSNVREIIGDMPILIPGVDAQGGDLQQAVTNGKDSNNQGFIINSSRGIIYSSSESNFGEVAGIKTRSLNDKIKECLK